MMLCIIGFCIGILSLHFFSELPSLLATMAGCSIGIALLALLAKQFTIAWIKNLVISAIIGFMWALVQAQAVIKQGIPSDIEGKTIEVIGVIHQIPEQQENLISFEFKIEKTLPQSLWQHPGMVKVRWKNPNKKLTVGDKWQLFLRLKRPRSYSNEGSFDKERHFFQKGIVAEGHVVSKLAHHKIASDFLSYPVDRIRTWLKAQISKALKGKKFSGVIQALVIGEKDQISFDQWQVFKNTGTAHLMAISGLHVGLVAGFAFTLVRLLGYCAPLLLIKFSLPPLAAFISMNVALFYSLIAGFSVSTQRALIMITILMIATLRKRHYSGWRNYGIAFGLILLINPLATLNLGFWLSFGAVGIILYGMKNRLKPTSVWWRWGRTHWVIFWGLAPLSLASFGMVSFSSPFANLIAIPWVSLLVIPFSLLGALSFLLHPSLASAFLQLAEYCISLLWPFLQILSQAPNDNWLSFQGSPLTLLLAFIGILLLLAPRGLPGKFIGVIWLLPFFLLKPVPLQDTQALITVLDVGQGLATVIETKNHVLVFDTGPKLNAYTDTGERVILPFLRSRNRKKIDVLMISHGDTDHIGGARSILNTMKVDLILTSEPELFPEKNKMNCVSNQKWEWDGIQFEMLHPDHFFSKKRNDHSCVLKVKTQFNSFLLTADIETISEKRLLARNASKLKSTILLVPHHGSHTSSSLEFIQAVNPEYAIIPVGYRNRYGHPKPDIVARYQKARIKVLDTVHDGAISWLLTNDKTLISPHCYRLDNKRYWHFMTYPYPFDSSSVQAPAKTAAN